MYHRKLNSIFPSIIQRPLISSAQSVSGVKYGLSLLFLLFSIAYLPAQTRRALEEKRTSLELEIQSNSNRLQTIKKDKSSKLEQYIGIKSQVERRKKLLGTYQEEIDLLDSLLLSTQHGIDSLILVNNQMKKRYASLLQAAYRMKVNESSWQFIFSASSFNDGYRRWLYLQQYKSAIRQHSAMIKAAEVTLQQEQDKIKDQRSTQLELLTTQKNQYQEVEKELKQTDQLIKRLDSSERRLAADITKQKKAFLQLNATIEKAIQHEIALQKKATKQNTVERKIAATTTKGFSNNKGNLPWPVAGGKIVSSFGRHPHPKIKSVQIINNGVDIKANKRAPVTSIYDGEVVSTQVVPGYKNTVIIRHADYYTVYSNMENINVKRGNQITKGQKIGRLGSDASLHFEIWHNKDRMNPVHWIR